MGWLVVPPSLRPGPYNLIHKNCLRPSVCLHGFVVAYAMWALVCTSMWLWFMARRSTTHMRIHGDYSTNSCKLQLNVPPTFRARPSLLETLMLKLMSCLIGLCCNIWDGRTLLTFPAAFMVGRHSPHPGTPMELHEGHSCWGIPLSQVPCCKVVLPNTMYLLHILFWRPIWILMHWSWIASFGICRDVCRPADWSHGLS